MMPIIVPLPLFAYPTLVLLVNVVISAHSGLPIRSICNNPIMKILILDVASVVKGNVALLARRSEREDTLQNHKEKKASTVPVILAERNKVLVSYAVEMRQSLPVNDGAPSRIIECPLLIALMMMDIYVPTAMLAELLRQSIGVILQLLRLRLLPWNEI